MQQNRRPSNPIDSSPQPQQLIKGKRPTVKQRIFCLTVFLIPFSFFGLISTRVLAQDSDDIELQVGVVQRFGEKPGDKLTLKATPGDRLILQLSAGQTAQTIETPSVKLEIQTAPLTGPALSERLVLGSYRSFESAENTANQWQAKGIPVEIAQPQRWQVWAKRDIYSTPLLRRLLLQSLQAQGVQNAYLDSKIVKDTPMVSGVVNGQRYNFTEAQIRAGAGVIEVKRTQEKKSSTSAASEKTSENEQPAILYGGSLRVQPNAYGTYTLVNKVPLETYLRGVVPHEIGGEAPYASIEAQTILARTYVLRNLRRFAADNYQICANTQCQVYKGLTGTWEPADQAINATRGLVLTYENELVDALYSSTSGGVTAPFTDMWQGEDRPYLVGLIDAPSQIWDLSKQSLASEENFRQFISLKKGFNEDEQDLFRWREQSSLEKLNQELRRYLQERQHSLANFKTIQGLQVKQRSHVGRVLKVAVQTDKGILELEKDEILRAFYEPWSTLFYLEPVYGEDKKTLKGYAFIGGGFGHGVGMSQFGSYKLAKLGWSKDQILSFYYPGTEIKPLGKEIVFWLGNR